ncbi:MAG: tetratricopeptide repeat protein [Burkholderiaceae bacterium]|nr:tetratricopeptide repeat protein [Burkholderiaceae bacterium]
MARLILRLLGPGELLLDGVPVRLHSAKTLALLAYLALEHPRAHGRERLAALLWAEQSDAAARQSLRQALYSLNHALNAPSTASSGTTPHGCVDASPELVRFVPPASAEIDVLRFLECVHATGDAPWREAAALYRAPLLDGKELDGCPTYQSWLDAARERLHALAMQNLDRLVLDAYARADRSTALQHARALRDLDPASEPAARHLLRIHSEAQDWRALDAEWQRLQARLHQDLGVQPSRESSELYRRLRGEQAVASTADAGSGAVPSAGNAAPGQGARRAIDPDALLRAARAAEGVHAFSQAVDLYGRALRVLAQTPAASAARRVDLLLLQEAALERLGRRAEQVSTIAEALSAAEALADDARTAAVLLRQAGASSYLDDDAQACRCAERALLLYRRLGDQPGEAEALRELGFAHWHAEQHAAALQCARDALALHRQLGDAVGEASALHNLAEIHRGLGSPRQALHWYEQAIGLHWAARNHRGEILSRFGMANALQQAGDALGAMRQYKAALRSSEEHGEHTMRSRALHALAMHSAAQSELGDALTLLRRAIQTDRSIGYAHALGHDLVDLAALHQRRGECVEARTALHEALVWFDLTEDHAALEGARERLADLDAGRETALTPMPRRGVKSHLALGEGKVYCEFESPLAR